MGFGEWSVGFPLKKNVACFLLEEKNLWMEGVGGKPCQKHWAVEVSSIQMFAYQCEISEAAVSDLFILSLVIVGSIHVQDNIETET